MQKLLRQGLPFALTTFAACVGSTQLAHAAPTAGAYVSDRSNTWVQDRVGDRIGSVNMIMCIIGSMRADAMVNQGAYVALIDSNRCEGRGDSSKSTSTNAGASNATNYMSSVVQATQASANDPLVIKAWLSHEEDDNGTPRKMTIYAYVVASAGKSEQNPNGLFDMYFCGKSNVPDSHGGALEDCAFRGSLKSAADGLSFYEEGEESHGTYSTRLKLLSNPNTDSGYGSISAVEGGSPPDVFNFAYDPNQFRRDDGVHDTCLWRDTGHAEYSTWRYGTYEADGARLAVSHPGFPVKFQVAADPPSHREAATYYGFWSFWGLWLPESAMQLIDHGALTRRVGDADVSLDIEKHGGKLWKLTRNASTLADQKNISMMFSVPPGMSGLQANQNYEVKWNGSILEVVGQQVCGGNGCSPQPLNAPLTLTAASLRAVNVTALPIFFPSGGGNGSVAVPSTGEFGGGDTVYFRSRELVTPGSTALHLDCVNQCLKSGADLTNGLAASPQQVHTGTWGPTQTLASYTFVTGSLAHDNNGGALVDASGLTKEQMNGFQWGLNSGSMIDHANVADIRCDMNGTPNQAGAYYCPSLVDNATVIYQWETGPNQWNQYFGAAGVTIDPPKNLNLAAHFVQGDGANTISGGAASNYHGNNVQLQFSGFGELQGLPGGCVDPDTNAAVPCSQNTRWVPAFNIVDGATVTGDGSSYFVKFLERELRLGEATCSGSSPSLSGASGLTLPTSAVISVNSRAVLTDTVPTPVSPKPSVIDGTLQNGG